MTISTRKEVDKNSMLNIFDKHKNFLIEGSNLCGMTLLEGIINYDLILISPLEFNIIDEKCKELFYVELKKSKNLLNERGLVGVCTDSLNWLTVKKIMDNVYEAKNYIKTFLIQNIELQPINSERKINNRSKYLIVYKKTGQYDQRCDLLGIKNSVTFEFNPKKANKEREDDLEVEKNIVSILTNKTSNILSIYGNSGLVAIATMELNEKDGGDRSFTVITDKKDMYLKVKDASDKSGVEFKYITICSKD